MKLSQRLRWTLRGLRRAATQHPAALVYLRPWLQSLWTSYSPLKARRPWISYPALAWLNRHVDRDMRVFEFGSGGSTLYFADRAGGVVTVEHDPEWYAGVRAALDESGATNSRLNLISAEPVHSGISELYVAERKPMLGQQLERYARSIDAYPDESFDLVFVDGWARRACIRHALPKVKRGGYVMLDNAEWPEFAVVHDWLSDFPCQRFVGFGPCGDKPWETTVWQIDRPAALARAA